MISTKEILSQIYSTNHVGHQLTDEDLAKLQNHLIKMYHDLESVCKRHNLTMTMAYGNVLGAMRHKGWIPWDDDLDVHMPRKDYDLFLNKFANELPSRYIVYAPHTKHGPIYRFAKIIDTETTFVQLGEEGKPYHQGVFIDIFPLESISQNWIKNRLSKIWSYFLMYTATSVDMAKHSSKIYEQIMYATRNGKINHNIRKTWGKIFSFASPKKWYCWIDSFHRNSKHTGYMHMPTIIRFEPWHPIRESLFIPGHKVAWGENDYVMVPGKTDKETDDYLTMIYGDWHKMPPKDQIWHHYVSEFDIPD